jgi:hypothetical protein
MGFLTEEAIYPHCAVFCEISLTIWRHAITRSPAFRLFAFIFFFASNNSNYLNITRNGKTHFYARSGQTQQDE